MITILGGYFFLGLSTGRGGNWALAANNAELVGKEKENRFFVFCSGVACNLSACATAGGSSFEMRFFFYWSLIE